MPFNFSGGIFIEEYKHLSDNKPIEKMSAPKTVILPILGCKPLVQVGDTVAMYQKVAETEGPFKAPMHASVSGKVTAIAAMPETGGGKVLSIVIENDFEDRIDKEPVKYDPEELNPKEIEDIIREAGVVGMGGAGFPAHVKISGAREKNADVMIVNGAECEPYITADHRTLYERAESVVKGAEILAKASGVKRVVIAVEKNKQNVFPIISELIKDKEIFEYCELPVKYPQGSEKQLVYAVTKKEIPAGRLPADVGCVLFNVGSCAAVHDAFYEGIPLVKRVVTVSGDGIKNPGNFEVRVGTPISDVIEAAGGFSAEVETIIAGGPMMGFAQFDLSVPVTKATNSVLALCKGREKESASCIRCGKCVSVCPMKLAPVMINMFAQKGDIDECKRLGVMNCIECGCCAHECPARLYLVQQFRTTKQKIVEKQRKEKEAAAKKA